MTCVLVKDLRRRRTGDAVFVVGDVHGRKDLLLEALGLIDRHPEGGSGQIVFLGDYVDRGPDSAGVVSILRSAALRRAVCLRGNHEQLLLDAARSGEVEAIRRWTALGGAATLKSYGAEDAGARPGAEIPVEDLAWMERLCHAAIDEHRIYVHAGVEPGVPLSRQRPHGLLWVRDSFLSQTDVDLFPGGRHVVHGHTPLWRGKPQMDAPERLAHRTNLDTGAYETGVLAVGVFDRRRAGGPVEILRAVGQAPGPETAQGPLAWIRGLFGRRDPPGGSRSGPVAGTAPAGAPRG